MKKIGLIPAAGTADRIAPLPCSKELYPIGFHPIGAGRSPRPKVVSQYLLEKMRIANTAEVYMVLRKGKWDIPEYFGDGKALSMRLAYLIMDLPFGVPYTLDQAYPFVRDSMVVFGFPDIIFQPDNAFVQLLTRQAATKADIVLGIFTAHQPRKMDMVDMDANGRIREIQIKPDRTDLKFTWIFAVWTPVFTDFMHEYILTCSRQNYKIRATLKAEDQKEMFIGDVVQAAIDNGLLVENVIFFDGDYLDIGTPADLVKAVRESPYADIFEKEGVDSPKYA
jgi:glucose-1-phosphate thymidylyltransferase